MLQNHLNVWMQGIVKHWEWQYSLSQFALLMPFIYIPLIHKIYLIHRISQDTPNVLSDNSRRLRDQNFMLFVRLVFSSSCLQSLEGKKKRQVNPTCLTQGPNKLINIHFEEQWIWGIEQSLFFGNSEISMDKFCFIWLFLGHGIFLNWDLDLFHCHGSKSTGLHDSWIYFSPQYFCWWSLKRQCMLLFSCPVVSNSSRPHGL